MPAPAASCQVAYLLSTSFTKDNIIGWDTEVAINNLGIKCAPSVDPAAPIPVGLNAETAPLVAKFIEAVREKDSKSRMKYIQGARADANEKGRTAWKKWYVSTIAPALNRVVDAVWKEHEMWPFDMMMEQAQDEFPITDHLATQMYLGVAIFGPCVGNGVYTANTAQPYVKSFMVHNVARVRKAWKRIKIRMEGQNGAGGEWTKLVEMMEQVIKEETIGTDDVKVISRLMTSIESMIPFTPDKGAKFAEYSEIWRAFLEDRDVEVEAPKIRRKKPVDDVEVAKATAIGKKIKWKASDIANEVQIKEALSELIHHFEARGGGEIETLDDLVDSGTAEIWAQGMGHDELGVEKFCLLTPDQLNKLLGFVDGRPGMFAKWISSEPTENSWTEGKQSAEEKKQWEEGGEGLQQLKLKWHQLCGIASMVNKTFVADGDTKAAKNVLLADDVGVGKTAQLMGIIAFLIEAVIAEQEKKPLPDILGAASSSFMGKGPVPDLPHLLVIPNSLVAQWHQELKRFFGRHAIDIFELPSNAMQANLFFTEGPWVQSKRENIRKVLLCSHPTLGALAANRFEPAKRGMAVDDAHEIRKGNTLGGKAEGTPLGLKTIFGEEWCTTIIDEIHEFRVPSNRNFFGACELERVSRLVIGASATPLVSQPRDLQSVCRILDVEGMRGQDGKDFEARYRKVFGKARKEVDAEDHSKALHTIQDLMKKGEEYIKPDDKALNPMFTVTTQKYFCVREIRKVLANHMIRRTIDSRTWEDKPISELKPKHVVNYLVELTEAEKTLLHTELDSLKTKSKLAFGFHFEAFLVHYRVTIAHPTPRPANPKASRQFPKFVDKEDYEKNPGSKLTALINILQHHLADDDALPLSRYNLATQEMLTPVESREPTAEPAPESSAAAASDLSHAKAASSTAPATTAASEPSTAAGSAQQPTQTKKILVYFAFSAVANTISSALRAHGINPYVITGLSDRKVRARTVDAWRKSEDLSERVLLFSQVGTTGHNLADASIVIHFDQNWSSIIDQQIDGRAWRMGQKGTVLIYHILAMGTTDTLMHSMANEKDAMLKGLVSRDVGGVFAKVMAPAEPEEDNPIALTKDEIEEEERNPNEGDANTPSTPKAGPSKTTSRAKTAPAKEKAPSTRKTAAAATSSSSKALKANDKGKKKAVNEEIEPSSDDDDQDDDDDKASKAPTTQKKSSRPSKKAAPKSKGKGNKKAVDDEIEPSSDDGKTSKAPTTQKKSSRLSKKAAPKSKGKGKKKALDDEMGPDSDDRRAEARTPPESEEEQDDVYDKRSKAPTQKKSTRPSKKAAPQSKEKGKQKAAEDKMDTEEEEQSPEPMDETRDDEEETPKKAPKSKNKGKKTAEPATDTDSDIGDSNPNNARRSRKAKVAATPKKSKGKGKRQASPTSDSSQDDPSAKAPPSKRPRPEEGAASTSASAGQTTGTGSEVGVATATSAGQPTSTVPFDEHMDQNPDFQTNPFNVEALNKSLPPTDDASH